MDNLSLQKGCARNFDESTKTLYGEIMSEKQMLKDTVDLESQPILNLRSTGNSVAPLAMEYRVPARTKMAYLGGYFLLNLGLTLYNKALLGNVRACQQNSRLVH